MKVLILSHFDPIIGPRIFLKAPESGKEGELEFIPSLMDIYEEKFFIHITEKIKCANYIFTLENRYARGKEELLQISIVIDINSEIDLNLAHELLDGFVKEVIKIDDIYKAFYVDTDNYDGGSEKLEELKNLFFSFYKSFKPAVRALKIAEHRYRSLFKAARDAIFIIDRKKAKIVDANQKAEKIIGKTREEIINLKISDLHPSGDYVKVKKKVLDLIKLEEGLPIEARILNSSGKIIPVEMNASEIKIRDENYIQIILRDITERKIAELKLIKSEEKYRKAFDRANFYKDLFAYDLNNILGNINSSVDLIPQLENKNKLYHVIKGQALRGLNLILYIQQILDIDDSDISLERLEINKLLKEAISLVTNNFQQKLVEINVETPGNNLFVNSSVLLLDVFESILINASENNDNPFVLIQIKISKQVKGSIRYMKVEFIDNGVGISDDVKEKIFQRGYKQGKNLTGMGLGLYIVKRIINSSNGYIFVEDKVQNDYTKGTNFIILLPEA